MVYQTPATGLLSAKSKATAIFTNLHKSSLIIHLFSTPQRKRCFLSSENQLSPSPSKSLSKPPNRGLQDVRHHRALRIALMSQRLGCQGDNCCFFLVGGCSWAFPKIFLGFSLAFQFFLGKSWFFLGVSAFTWVFLGLFSLVTQKTA